VGNARIASPAIVPEKHAGSGKLLILGAGVVAGSLLFVLTAFLLDLQDPVIRTVQGVRERFRYPVLGMIPYLKHHPFGLVWQQRSSMSSLFAKTEPNLVGAEAYRMLQINLKMLNRDEALKSIVVTSAVPQEGKSTVSANLAYVLAQLGQRVLVIDADLNHPSQHFIWQIKNGVGISNILTGEADFNQAITMSVMPNVDVLTAGPAIADPLTLIDSSRMERLLQACAQVYDVVLIDAPPLLVADALTISRNANGIMLVSRPGMVDAVSAATAKELLDRSGQTVLGLVANGVSEADQPGSYLHRASIYYSKRRSNVPVSSLN
jgi:polysaccharide biosynthesis transport protein